MRLEQLSEVTKTRAPPFVSLMLFGSTFATFAGFGVFGISAEYFSPCHTNSFSIMAQMLSNTTMALGVGAMSGFKYVNFSVLPSVSKRYSADEGTPIYRAVVSDPFWMYLPLALFMTSLTLLDGFNLFSIAPALLA